MQDKKRVLILTADAGFGHRSAANAIAAAIRDSYGTSCDCSIVNPADDPRAPSIIRRPQAAYDRTIRTFPRTYRLSYQISDSYPASRVVEGVIAQFMLEVFEEILRTYAPDVVISTYPLYNTALHSALARNKMDVPFFVVITDLADVHHLWFQPGADKYFAATEEVSREAILSHVPPHRVVLSGLPIDPRIAQEHRDKGTIRQSLGWDPELPALLAVGSIRMKGLLPKLEAVASCRIPLQLAIVAGGDNALFNTARSTLWNIPVSCYDYVHNMPEMLHAADLLITKAGGLITSEALACGLPIIFVEAIPGQETGNVRYVSAHSAGVMAKTAAQLQATICQWLESDQRVLREFARNASQLGRPDAAYQIAREIGEVISGTGISQQSHHSISP
ncbi:MAG: MGDG synthase family glycosyltransferase [Bacteroidota bacterium]